MFPFFLNVSMLAIESQQVIALRLAKLAFGGFGAMAETHLMVSEKIAESQGAAGRMMMGASAGSIVSRYRQVVQANITRLEAPSAR